jgi:putative phosphoserine phosphatase/1-acylglycerol-3-phosphate O-acyltransferase
MVSSAKPKASRTAATSGATSGASSAAFFDLDRTLLPGASGPAFSAALRRLGVLPARGVPGEGLLFGIFDVIGETLPTMLLARQGVRFTKGWDAELVAEAGRTAAQELVARVQPFARVAIEEHRRAGRRVVMATTSPAELAEPLGAALGFDAVIATRYRRVDGKLAGAVDGHYVWGKGKLAAVREWAAANEVDLGESYAYSDSVFDQPLLGAVGHPLAVNPDPRLFALATVRRWPVVWLDVPRGVPKLAGLEPQRALLKVIRPELVPYCRFDIAGLDHIPSTGPVILAANHRSYFDPMALGFALARLGRPVRFLAKRELFAAPVLGQLARSFGAIPVDRGSGSSGPLDAAARALAGGEVVMILPQGTIPRGEAFFAPDLTGRSGVVRLARMSGAPVVPVGLWGTELVWPRSAKLPNVWNVWNPPQVRVHVGAAIEPRRGSIASELERILGAITALLPPVADRMVVPTAEQLARTYPSGKAVASPPA